MLRHQRPLEPKNEENGACMGDVLVNGNAGDINELDDALL